MQVEPPPPMSLFRSRYLKDPTLISQIVQTLPSSSKSFLDLSLTGACFIKFADLFSGALASPAADRTFDPPLSSPT